MFRALLCILVVFTEIAATAAGEQDQQKVYAAAKGAVFTVRTDKGRGTGFLIDASHVVTCAHVIEGASTIQVSGSKSALWSVTGVRLNRALDLAVLTIDKPSSRRPLVIRSRPAKPGETALVIGSPLGLEGSLSSGLVSAIRKTGELNLVQLTATIAPGSSGSPVLDSKGQVMGVVDFTFNEGQALNMAIVSSHLTGWSTWTEQSITRVKAVDESRLSKPCLQMLDIAVEHDLKIMYSAETTSAIDAVAQSFRFKWDRFKASETDAMEAFAHSKENGQQLEAHIESLARMFEQYAQACRDQDKLDEENNRAINEGRRPDFALSKMMAKSEARGRVAKAWNEAREFCWGVGSFRVKSGLSGPAYYCLEAPLIATIADDKYVAAVTRYVEPDPDFPLECLVLNYVGTAEEAAELSKLSVESVNNVGKPNYVEFDYVRQWKRLFSIKRGDTIFAIRKRGVEEWTNVKNWKELSLAANDIGLLGTFQDHVELLVGRDREHAKPVEARLW